MLHSPWLTRTRNAATWEKVPLPPSHAEVNRTRNANSEEQNQDKNILSLETFIPA